jgi:predicted CXXCH cytochrome family protein
MHNSQDGTWQASGDDGITLSATANEHLTVSTCLGCHNGGVDAPNIFGTSQRTAGGTFAASVVDAGAGYNSRVHNVRDITWSNDEVALLNLTPGEEAQGSYDPPTGADELTCAGSKGCHGDHTKSGSADGIKGYHHASSPGYRFLEYYNGSVTKTEGKGSSTWEKGGATNADHNVYRALETDSADAGDSISSLCSLCHGGFHDNDDTANSGVWTRHPTDVSIPASWNATVDYENNPFAFDAAAWSSVFTNSAYTEANVDVAKVACISCHRAHGSDDADLLRFSYGDMQAGGSNTFGCLGCHTAQRGP